MVGKRKLTKGSETHLAKGYFPTFEGEGEVGINEEGKMKKKKLKQIDIDSLYDKIHLEENVPKCSVMVVVAERFFFNFLISKNFLDILVFFLIKIY